MRIIVDSREQQPYDFVDFGLEVERATLKCGDYSVPQFTDLVAVERKNGIDELVACLSSDRQRFEAELARARSFERFYVVIEGHFHDILAGRYRSRMAPKAVIASIAHDLSAFGKVHLRDRQTIRCSDQGTRGRGMTERRTTFGSFSDDMQDATYHQRRTIIQSRYCAAETHRGRRISMLSRLWTSLFPGFLPGGKQQKG